MTTIEKLRDFCADINEHEVNDHIDVTYDVDGTQTIGIDAEWLDGWHRAVDNIIGDIEHGWVELPLDADGVPIRVGDVMEERSGHTFEVASLMAFGGSDNWLVLSDPRNFASFREPHDIRHHHAPTVEDVLREFGDEVQRCCDTADTIAEYAAKLREVMGNGCD